jgi:hypothetical protein
MTTLAEAVQAVQARLTTALAALTPALPYAAQGESYTPPADGSAYARLSIQEPGSDQISLGVAADRIHRRDGLVVVQIYTPGGSLGRADLDGLLMTVRNVFEGVSFGGCHFGAVKLGAISANGEYVTGSVIAGFQYYETK